MNCEITSNDCLWLAQTLLHRSIIFYFRTTLLYWSDMTKFICPNRIRKIEADFKHEVVRQSLYVQGCTTRPLLIKQHASNERSSGPNPDSNPIPRTFSSLSEWYSMISMSLHPPDYEVVLTKRTLGLGSPQYVGFEYCWTSEHFIIIDDKSW
jgi:hypothetical protein